MAYNGSGTFVLVAGNPVVTGTTISSTWANNTLNDIATGLSTAITKDGQTTPTANIPMGGYKITGLGAPTANGDALRYENLASLATTAGIQAQTYTAFTTAGTSTAYTLTTSPAAAALAEDERYQVEWHTTSGATPTLARDGLTAKNLKVYDATGAKVAPATGALVAGVKNDVVYDGTDYVVLNQLPSVVPASGQCRLSKSGANLVLSPYGGNLLTVNGLPCTVPDAGVTLAPTGLSATTLYYIYAVATAGVITSLEASTTGHSADTTAGNKGVEIKTGDSTRSLVGMAYVKTAATFADTAAQRFVRSWFNDRGVTVRNGFTTDRVSAVTTGFEVIDAEILTEYAAWSGEAISASSSGSVSNSGVNVNRSGISFDSTTVAAQGAQSASIPSGAAVPMSVVGNKDSLTEGYHYLYLLGYVNAGTGTWSGSNPLGVILTASIGSR